jgi:uncharacterized protein (TIGR02145 family)
LKWDRKNTVIEGREHLNWHEALGVAQSLGKRLPTQKEWAALASLGSTWDCEKKGSWFGTDHQLMGRSQYSIFLPVLGYRSSLRNLFNHVGTDGYYWSSTPYSTHSDYFYFSSGTVYAEASNLRADGFIVRCVAE